ncbi:glycoside hydrolase family 3 N-terminal domain-containing protein [Marinilabilia salmonicolor]|uniref:glycoside hydrolase family 3 N-terminal domain-containing protein n=1 Tax=Marinilabilia salmonicolor TaxID=989 RepID=UPI000DF1163B|nr:glycoside hydrolase family 3 N-terminal domain-containing protein [Marinilabilia salmonicolor]
MRNKKIFLTLLLSLCVGVMSGQVYKNSSNGVEERTQDLLSRMTLEEKVGQLLCPLGWPMYEKNGKGVEVSMQFKESLKQNHTGMLWATFRADPWTRKTLRNGLNPVLAAEVANSIQKYAMEETRLGIPLFLAEEAPHGHMAIGATVFPTGIGLASTWAPELIEEVGKVIGREVRLQGGHIGYGPVLDLVRDARWSRVEETYGEDPVLAGIMGAAMVRGMAGDGLHDKYGLIATLKHFLAYGTPEAGQNGGITTIGPLDVMQNYLPPFKEAINAGALSVMTSYNSIDGIPSTSNRYLLTDVLRNKWGFNGFVVSDLASIEGLHGSHYVAKSVQEAANMALSAGVDVDLGSNAFVNLVNSVNAGELKESLIDTAVARVLRLKFEMGLFDDPYVDPRKAERMVRCPEHIALAREVAQNTLVLLKNEHEILPLKRDPGKILVVGPNADNQYNMLGDYTAPQDSDNVVTILEGILNKLSPEQVEYVKGCAIRDTSNVNIDKAVEAAEHSDVILAVVGGSSARDFKTEYLETGAAVANNQSVSDMDAGEGFDRATLDLLGKQMDLLKALKKTGKPLVVVYIQGRPMKMNWAAENADALICAWYPGQEGGNALADVVFGDYNPAGRLPVSIPRDVGQVPIYYNKKNPRPHDYVELSATPLYSFGYGLSYSSFTYSDLEVAPVGKEEFVVNFKVKNTGNFDGDEVVQLYLRDEYASVVQPVQQLKHFNRLFLKKGEEKQVSFYLNEKDLAILNQKKEWVVEPGTFQLMIGAASDDIRLSGTIKVD